MLQYSNFKSKLHLCWLVFGSSTYWQYAFVASILAALMPSLICNRKFTQLLMSSELHEEQKLDMSAMRLITILGATASGKTRLAVELAQFLGGEIISADSRQVFRGMDIGTGKDLDEYGELPYHLIDLMEAGEEYSVYDFQRHFLKAYIDITGRGRQPVMCGGTGLYLDAILRGYLMVEAPRNDSLRLELADKSDAELVDILLGLKPGQHNTTDLLQRERTVRAIEIAKAEQAHTAPELFPPINHCVVGIRWERSELRRRITERLNSRLQNGMVEEIERLHAQGVSWERLLYYGLEYRYGSLYLQGELNYNDMVQKLNSAIHDFAKRQETWFRRLEKRGVVINWFAGGDGLATTVKERILLSQKKTLTFQKE